MTIDDLCAEAAELLTTKEVHPELFRVLEKKGYSPWMHEVASTERMTVHMPPAYLFARASCGKTARSFLSVFAQWSERLAASDKSIEVMANGEWPALLSWMETKAFDEASSRLDDYRLARLLSCEIRKGIAETDRPFAREWPGRSADFWARLGAEACIRGTSKSCVWARKWAEKAFSEFEAASSSLKRGESGESGRFVSPQGLRRLTQKMVLARATGLKVALLNETGFNSSLLTWLNISI